MREDRKIGTVGIHALDGCRIERAVGAATVLLARLVGSREPLVAGVEIVAAVMPKQHHVQTVVVVNPAPATEQRFLRNDVVVLVFRVDDEVWRLRNDDLVAEYGNPQRRQHFWLLVENLS